MSCYEKIAKQERYALLKMIQECVVNPYKERKKEFDWIYNSQSSDELDIDCKKIFTMLDEINQLTTYVIQRNNNL